jgi:hypothetical protein
MVPSSELVLPYEAQYVGHRDAEKRRKDVSEWLNRRERELDEHSAPSLVPETRAASKRP